MTSPRTLLKAWNLNARKALGQNFLRNPVVGRQIVDQAQLTPSDVVLEIGAGLGAVTIAAARQAGTVIAVEKDRRLVPLLRTELLACGLNNVRIVQDDFLALDLEALAAGQGRSLVVLGNLPYNISSQVVVKLIQERRCVQRAILMFQKELAQRLCAGPGTRTYGRLSVMLRYCADLTLLRQVCADQFYPRPKVDSTLLGMRFKAGITHAVKDEQLLSLVVQSAFGQRRKTLRNALAGGLPQLDTTSAKALLHAADINPRRRAETLSVEEFVNLTNCLQVYQQTAKLA